MVKTRMGVLDLRVQAAALNAALSGVRVANVYDAHNGRTYILKLAVPPGQNSNAPWEKRLLLVESGARVHITGYDRDKDLPTGFCLKLRKHLRARKLESVRQLGGDRILEMVFSGGGQVVARLIIEMFSGGNILLTDENYIVLTLLRTYKGTVGIAVKERYPVEERCMTEGRVGWNQFCDKVRMVASQVPAEEDIEKASTRSQKKRLMEKAVPKKALAVALRMEPALVEHALLKGGYGGGGFEELTREEAVVKGMFEEIERVDSWIKEKIEQGGVGGVVICGMVEGKERYEEFWPFLFEQFKGRIVKEFNRFDDAADEFFSRLEAERAEAAQLKREKGVYRKVDKLANELKGQVSMFESARDLSWERAQAIEGNITEVEAALTVILSAIAAAVPWDGLAKMVKEEKKNGNPVAEIIHSLQLERNEITLMLEDTFGVNDEEEDEEEEEDDNDSNEEDDDDENNMADEGDDTEESDNRRSNRRNRRRQRFEPSSQTRKALLVSLDLNLGAHANARRHYEMRKSAAAKMEKAVQVTDRTLKAASKRAATEAHKIESEAVAASIRARRKTLWFEKFFWFISSENYLVVAGHDAQQNEMLVNRYLGPADVYVHAELPGASSVIVKNRRRGDSSTYSEIPRMTLEQAGTFAMCRSAAWESKIVTSAWWVRASQVAKTTTSGAYLPTGSFIIRGKKNFLDPTQLVMGLAFIFKVDEQSAIRHRGERGVRGLEEEEEVEVLEREPKSSESAEGQGDDSSAPAPVDEPVLESQDAISGYDEAGSATATLNDGNNATNESKEYDSLSAGQGSSSGDSADRLVRNKYQQSSPEESEQSEPKKMPRSKKKHMSAKERRALKSGKSSGQISFDGSVAPSEADGEITASLKGHGGTSQGKGNKSNAPLPRGKKHKLKKMKKYLDQDDEERRIALAVLGSKLIKEEEPEQDDEESETEDEMKEAAAKKDTRSENRRRQEDEEERREKMRLLSEDGQEELANLEKETLSILDMLTAIPDVNDSVEYALPVCAPYGALANYRYKVKLMPGNTKRGKAYRAAMILFQRQAEKDLKLWKQERDAIRLSPESDGIQGMLGSVKIMAPGLAEAQKAAQKTKKGGKETSSSKKGSRQKS